MLKQLNDTINYIEEHLDIAWQLFEYHCHNLSEEERR